MIKIEMKFNAKDFASKARKKIEDIIAKKLMNAGEEIRNFILTGMGRTKGDTWKAATYAPGAVKAGETYNLIATGGLMAAIDIATQGYKNIKMTPDKIYIDILDSAYLTAVAPHWKILEFGGRAKTRSIGSRDYAFIPRGGYGRSEEGFLRRIALSPGHLPRTKSYPVRMFGDAINWYKATHKDVVK